MSPDFHSDGGPAIEYLLKEVSYSTCDNRFFGELEKEMLIPNKVNIYGRITGAPTLKGHRLRVEFPADTVVGYLKQPLSSAVEGTKRVLVYNLEDLINYEDYWWFPLRNETEFNLGLHLLPPFPDLNPMDLQISCRPDIATGLETEVTTTIRIEANEDIDYLFLRLNAPIHASPGISTTISEYSGDSIREARQQVASPVREFPFPSLNMKKGQATEYRAKTMIKADPANMNFLRCETDVLTTRLLLLRESSPSGPPCDVSILDEEGQEIPVRKTVRSTMLQASGWIMYSPFSLRREPARETKRETLLETPIS